MGIVSSLHARRRYFFSFLHRDLANAYLCSLHTGGLDARGHLDAAARWICRAQDAFPDGGVARSYSLVYSPYSGRRGWHPSYPETTGYIIPTMFDYANLTGNSEIYDRTVRMADWECDVQMTNGAVQGGTIDQAPTPAIFNTGQVIFGWVRAFQETGTERYLTSAIRAGDFLVREQDEDGAWRKNLSNYASTEMKTYTYNTRTAWSLLNLHSVTEEEKYRESATRNLEHSLGQQQENGWFRNNCLSDAARPLLHTIAYCIRGFLEVGIRTGNRKYVDAAMKASEALLAKQRQNGALSGRFDAAWEAAVPWSCLTGDAQISIIWGRMYQHTGARKFLEGMKRANAYLKKVQYTRTRNPHLFGGIGGSDPIHGGYGRFEVLNWATKFFMDALMLEMNNEEH